MEGKIQEQIINIVERLAETKITTKNRKREKVTARAVYSKLCRDIFPDMSLAKIGKPINRDHATIIHMFRIINDHLKNDKDYITLYKKASSLINKDLVSTTDLDYSNYLESLEDRITELSDLATRQNESIQQLSSAPEKYKAFEQIPDYLLKTFIETRLEPFLKLHNANT